VLGLTKGELGFLLALLAIIIVGCKLHPIADAIDRALSSVRRRSRS
jgi:hypothetical protein